MSEGALVASDGKAVRCSDDTVSGCPAIELVSAWARENRLTLGHDRVTERSNEITAVPELLKVLMIKGCVMRSNTSKEIVVEIRRRGDDAIALSGC